MKTATKKKSAPAAITLQPEQPVASTAMVPANSPIAAATQQVVSLMATALQNPKLDVRKMREIMDMQMDAMRYQAELSFNRAMVECQAVIPQIHANSKNPHTKSAYANLEAIDTVVRPIIAKHGFSLNFNTEPVGDRHIRVMCAVRHIDGHKEPFAMVGELDDGGMKGNANKTGIQAAGSSSSYLVRYLIKLIFHVVIIGEDKDGNKDKDAAGKKSEGQQFTEAVHGKVIDGASVDVTKKLTAEANRLLAALDKPKDKSARSALVNRNLPLLRELDKAGLDDLVQSIHAKVDKGA